MSIPAQAPADCKVACTLEVEPGSTDFQTIKSQTMYDLSSQNGSGALQPCAFHDLRMMWFQIDCTDCAGITHLKLVEPETAADSPVNCYDIPAGAIFTMGTNGMAGAGGDGVKALGVKLAGGATSGETAKVLCFFGG